MSISKRAVTEFIGTFWLVFGGCGSAVFAAKFLADNPNINMGIGFVGVALAFGLTVLTMAYAIGHISGCHFEPGGDVRAVRPAGRFPAKDIPGYVIAQVLGGIAAAAALRAIASGHPGFNIADGLASNGYGDHSPGHYTLAACFITEALMTFFFLIIILGATDKRAPRRLRPARHRPRT